MKSLRFLIYFSILFQFNSYGYSKKHQTEFVGMKSSVPASQWQDALVSGNGTMGILVFGNPENEQIIFNHEFCYEPIGTEDVEPPDIAKYLPEVRRLFKEGKYKEAHEYSYKMAVKEGFPGILWTDPYHPAFQMNIVQPKTGNLRNYSRSVNFTTGEVNITWSDDAGNWTRKSFVSRPDHMIVQQIKSDAPINTIIEISNVIKKEETGNKQQINLNIKKPELEVSSDWITFRQAYSLNKRGYESGTKIFIKNGTSEVIGDKVKITGAKEILLFTRINYLEDYSISELEKTKKTLDAISLDYDALLNKHAKVHGEIFTRVKLDPFTGGSINRTSEQLIKQQKENPDSLDPAFLETMFNMGRYVLISSSGENPPNLMALWNGEWRPAWSGDFTLDANLNLQISSANLGNLKESIDSYMKLLERISPDWETNAKKLYGCRGFLSGTRTSGRRNLHTHFDGGYFPGHFWLAGAEWLLLPCFEYYQVSGDVDFLKNRLLPMMKNVVLFFEDFLTEYDKSGNFLFVPSYSPENRPSNIRSFATINATMDIAAAKEAIKNLIAVCEELNIENENIQHWKAMLNKMPPYLVNSDGALKEWASNDLEDNYNHRHVSHLYPVWPGLEINPEETPALFQAAKVAAQKRGRGNGSAHGLAHMALIGSRLKMDELVYGNLLFMLKNDYVYRGLFTSHNPNQIFNADMLNSLPAVVMEMLLYSRPGVIELLPACSSKLTKGAITGIKCRTQATVENLEWDFIHKKIKATISSDKNQSIEFMYRKGFKDVKCSIPINNKTENAFFVELEKGKPINLEFSLF